MRLDEVARIAGRLNGRALVGARRTAAVHLMAALLLADPAGRPQPWRNRAAIMLLRLALWLASDTL